VPLHPGRRAKAVANARRTGYASRPPGHHVSRGWGPWCKSWPVGRRVVEIKELLYLNSMYYPNVIYHVYNHTNNKEPLFRNEANYHLFLKKLRTHLLPVADLMCYCLMPTHFHLQLLPKAVVSDTQNS